MVATTTDASNRCLPGTHPVVMSVPPLPSCVRGERCVWHVGACGGTRWVYASQKLVVCRTWSSSSSTTSSNNAPAPPLLPPASQQPSTSSSTNQITASSLPVLVYRGHAAPVTAVRVSPSGAYVASGDVQGHYKIWALDHVDHWTKYELNCALTGPIRDLDWDGESQRVALVGERAGSDAQGPCAKVLQWDTGVTLGSLGVHVKGRATSCSFKPQRPMRIVTAGRDDSKCLLHAGPPFKIVPVQDHVPCQTAHSSKGAVTCVRYNAAGTRMASVGADRSIVIYDGPTMRLLHQELAAHYGTIYDVAWSRDDHSLLTASADGTCKLWKVLAETGTLQEVQVYKPAEVQLGALLESGKVAPVGGQQTGCGFLSSSNNSNIPISVGLNGQMTIFEPGVPPTVITGHYAPIAAMAMDWRRNLFYTGDTDGILCQWDLTTLTARQRILPAERDGKAQSDLMYIVHSGAVSGLAVAGKNGKLLSTGWDDKLRVSNNIGQEQANLMASLSAQPTAIASGTKLACIATVKGLIIVVTGDDGTVTVGSLVSVPYEANVVAVAKNDETVYVGGKDCKIYIYTVCNTTELKLKHCIENGHLKPIHSLKLSNGGQKLASADEKDICVWNLWDYDTPIVARGKWCFHVQRITSLSWSPDDLILASGGADDSIYLWHIEKKMRRVHYPFAHRGGIVAVEFFKDRLQLLTVGVDSVVNVWDVKADLKAKFDYDMKDIVA